MQKLFWLLFPIAILFGQLNYTGSFKPGNMHRLSDQTEISLPFRLIEVEIGYSMGDFEIQTNSALEYRWSNNENDLQFREIYIMWYPEWGELKLGKQIHAWGTVDGNNPTDNLNPYDYYYMFLLGAERKVGNVSGSIKYYWNDWQFEGVFIPKHVPNRMPFNETAFPIKLPASHPPLIELETVSEFGIRIQTTNDLGDFSFSIFRGRDRSFDYVGHDVNVPVFSYRKTNVVGLDGVFFIGNITNRFEVGFFTTENDFEIDSLYFNNVSYIQYAEQIDYTTPNDIILSAQVIGSMDGVINWDKTMLEKESDFKPGMGTPFASFTDLALLLAAQSAHMDNALDLKINLFTDLKDTQIIYGFSADYFPKNDWQLNFSVSKIIGGEETQFQTMEDFSHTKIGLKYHF